MSLQIFSFFCLQVCEKAVMESGTLLFGADMEWDQEHSVLDNWQQKEAFELANTTIISNRFLFRFFLVKTFKVVFILRGFQSN